MSARSGGDRPLVAVCGAGGKTGRAVVAALRAGGAAVRPLVRRPSGDTDERVVDLLDEPGMRAALGGVDAVYHLAPNMHPGEVAMAVVVAGAARACGVARVVFHSVLRPQLRSMPHHWAKLLAEEVLVTAPGVEVTVVQPGAYLQNFDPPPPGQPLRVPYSLDAPFSLVHLPDVAEVAARVLLEAGHEGATYELAGPQRVSVADVAAAFGVPAEREDVAQWAARARAGGLGQPQVDALVAMFTAYDERGLTGNPNVLAWLLGRAPTTLQDYAASRRLGRR